MSGDPGDGNELDEGLDRHREDDPSMTEVPAVSDEGAADEENATAYAGHAGGAVGGTPAQGRSVGGTIRGGIAPGGTHRGDSTVGADPQAKPEKPAKRSRKK